MSAIEVSDLSFTYDSGKKALNNISLEIKEGSFVAILGANGSGKSTLVRLLDLLIPLQSGSFKVFSYDATKKSNLYKIRREIGILFQNPESQFISSIANEDVAFGPENYGFSEEEVKEKVDEAFRLVEMEEYKERNPYTLSGGEMQRLALAGLLAISPKILIFDESLSMLDPKGRTSLMSVIKKVAKGRSVIYITHYAKEAIDADEVIILSKGEIVKRGSAREVLTDVKLLKENNLEVPEVVLLSNTLIENGIHVSGKALTKEELVEEICHLK